MSFMKFFAKNKMQSALKSVEDAMISFDPEAASEAQVEMIAKALDEASLECSKAQAEYDKEKAEAVQARQTYDQRIAAIKVLKGQMEGAGEEEAAAIKKDIIQLLDTVEASKVELEREEAEAKDAEQWLNECRTIVEEKATQLKTIRQALTEAKRNKDRAELTAEREKDREERKKRLAGISTSSNDLTKVLDTYNKKAAEAQAEANAAKMRSELLTPEQKAEESERVKAALAAAAGKPEPTSKSIEDRLAAL